MNDNCLSVIADEPNTSTTCYCGTRVIKPIKTVIWKDEEDVVNELFLKESTRRGASICPSKHHLPHDRSMSRDVVSQVAIRVAMVPQFKGQNGLIFTRSSQKGSVLGRLAEDSLEHTPIFGSVAN